MIFRQWFNTKTYEYSFFIDVWQTFRRHYHRTYVANILRNYLSRHFCQTLKKIIFVDIYADNSLSSGAPLTNGFCALHLAIMRVKFGVNSLAYFFEYISPSESHNTWDSHNKIVLSEESVTSQDPRVLREECHWNAAWWVPVLEWHTTPGTPLMRHATHTRATILGLQHVPLMGVVLISLWDLRLVRLMGLKLVLLQGLALVSLWD